MFRKALFIFSGNAATSAFTLGRNLLIARYISIENYGIAATFAMAMTLVEMFSTLGMQQQIVQAKEGDHPSFQAGLQGFNLVRGLLAGALLFFSAGFIADFFGVPEAAGAYQVLAIVPVLNSLQHFDIYRLTREMNFGPQIVSTLVPACLSFLFAWPLTIIFGDYRAMLFSVVIQVALMLLFSHLTAERKFSLSLDRKVSISAIRFGWPLLLNNFILFAVFNGDRVIVGRELGMADLAILAMGYTLTLTPTLIVAKSLQHFFLPQLSTAQSDNQKFDFLSIVVIQATTFLALLFLVVIFLFGERLIDVVLGDKFSNLSSILIWLSVMQAIRVAKAGAAIVALAKGVTTNALYANLPRLISLGFVWYIVSNDGSLTSVVFVGIAGEVCGLIVSYVQLQRTIRISLKKSYLSAVLAVMVVCVAVINIPPLSLLEDFNVSYPLVSTLMVALLALTIASMRPLIQYLRMRSGRDLK